MMALYLATHTPAWWASTPLRFAIAAAVTLAFAWLARRIRGVSNSGAIAGGVVCFLLLVCVGPAGFLALFSLFVVTWIATRLGRQRKQRLGTAERRDGRTAEQVLANLSSAAICAVMYATRGEPLWVVAMAAALAEAAADTVSSECGQAFSKTARLITTFESVPAGTDGGISIVGTLFGIGGAFLVGLVCVGSKLIPLRWLWLVTTAGVVGMLADSVLGAWLERRRWLNNDQVNLAGTVIAAVVGACLARAFS
jgi:uncharacterized protein (TIGR00297 family)